MILCRSCMREYNVVYSARVRREIDELTRWVSQLHTESFARRYINSILDEIEKLYYLAGVLPLSRNMMPLHYHPEAKTIPVGKRKLTVIFHIDGDYAIVDKILPSAMVMY